MTQFKVGDRVRRANGGKIWDSGPDTAIVKGIHNGDVFSVVDHPRNGKSYYNGTRDWMLFSDDFTLATPPATIQHEGHNYTRGEPVVPEWVKDGAWVINKLTWEVKQIHIMNESNLEIVAQFFRPFTNEDWKWGMWAEYKGEKVFVSVRDDGGVFASKPSNPYFFIPFCQITPTTAP